MTNSNRFFYIVMEGYAYQGESFSGLYTTLDSAVKKVEDSIKENKSSYEYESILKVYPDHPELTEEIGFREEIEMECYGCEERPLLLVGSREHSDWIDKHREQLKHGGVNCIRHTGRIVLDE